MIDISKVSTYQAGVYQSKAYRAFKDMKNSILKKHGLTMAQWSVLGFVYDAGRKGIRISDLAAKLDTTQAFITNTVNNLENKGMVKRIDHTTDGRTKLVVLEAKQKKVVSKIEVDIRAELRSKLYSKINRDELETYINVLIRFAEV